MRHRPTLRRPCMLAGVAAALLAATTHGAQSTLAWDPPTHNTDGTLVTNQLGYIMAYGLSSGTYDQTDDVGPQTNWTATNLVDGQVYYATVRAYNALGEQSDLSEELTWREPDRTPPSITAPATVAVVGNESDQAAIPDLAPHVTVSDNLSLATNITITQVPAIGTMVALGDASITMTATDEAGNTAQAIVVVSVTPMNRPPEVNAGADQSIRLPASTVDLVGSATDDGLPEGSSLTAQWSLVSGPAGSTFGSAASLSTTVSFTEAGSYVLRLMVSDGTLTATDDVTITVAPRPRPLPPTDLRLEP